MKSSGLFLLIMLILPNRGYSKENNAKEVRKGKLVEPRYNFNHPPSVEYYNPIPVAVVYENSNSYSAKSETTTKNQDDNLKSIEDEYSLTDGRKGKVAEVNHHLNHPPSVENYNPVSVVIVPEISKDYLIKSNIPTETEVQESENNSKVSIINQENPAEVATKSKQNNSTDSPDLDVNNKTEVKLVAKSLNLNNLQIPVAVIYDSDYNNYQIHNKRKTDINSQSPKSRSNYSRKIEISVKNQNEPTTQSSKENYETIHLKDDMRIFKKRIGDRDPVIPILEMESYVFSHNGNFRYSYEGGDGTKAYSEGKQITINDETGESVVGGFSYKDKEGNDYSLTYTADENGYRPVGAHLPTPPPTPLAIARALEYLATATPEPDSYKKKPSTA